MCKRQYFLLLIANAVSRMGSIVYSTVLAWWIIQVTQSTILYSYILIGGSVPIAIISPLGGVLADRFSKKSLLIITDCISGASSIVLSVMVFFHLVWIPAIIILNFLMGICSAIFKPAFKSIIPEVVQGDDLIKVNSMNTSIVETAKVVSPLVGGVFLLIPIYGVCLAFFFNGITFFSSAFSEYYIKVKKTREEKGKFILLQYYGDCITYMKKRSTIIIILLTCGIVNFFLSSIEIVLPTYVKDISHNNSTCYTVILMMRALGGVVGAVIILKLGNFITSIKRVYFCTFFTGFSLVFMGIFKNVTGVGISMLGVGMGDGLFNIMFYSYMQERVERNYLGRIFSINYTLAYGISPCAYYVVGHLSKCLKEVIYLYCGAGIMLSAIISYCFVIRFKEK